MPKRWRNSAAAGPLRRNCNSGVSWSINRSQTWIILFSFYFDFLRRGKILPENIVRKSAKKIHPLRSREQAPIQTFRDSASRKLASRLLQVSLRKTVVIIHAQTDNGTMGNAACIGLQDNNSPWNRSASLSSSRRGKSSFLEGLS